MIKKTIKTIGCASIAALVCMVGACSDSKKALSTACKNYADGQFYTGPENLTGKVCNANAFADQYVCTYSTGVLRRAGPLEEKENSWRITDTGRKACGGEATLQYTCQPKKSCDNNKGKCNPNKKEGVRCIGVPDDE